MKDDTSSWLMMTRVRKMRKMTIWSTRLIVPIIGSMEEKIIHFPIKKSSNGIWLKQYCRHCILYPLRLRPSFPNDIRTLKSEVGLRPNQMKIDLRKVFMEKITYFLEYKTIFGKERPRKPQGVWGQRAVGASLWSMSWPSGPGQRKGVATQFYGLKTMNIEPLHGRTDLVTRVQIRSLGTILGRCQAPKTA